MKAKFLFLARFGYFGIFDQLVSSLEICMLIFHIFFGNFEIFSRTSQTSKKGHFWPKKDAKWPIGPFDALEGSKWP